MINTKKVLLTGSNAESPVIADCVTMLKRYRFSEDDISQYTDIVTGILDDCAGFLGEEAGLEYRILRKVSRVELKLFLPVQEFDLFEDGEDANKRFFENLPNMNLNTEAISISERHISDWSIVSVSIPLALRKKKLLRDPMILVTIELSLASPGTSSAWVIMFETLGMPTGYVGLFTAYRLLTANYSAAATEAYVMLEEVEAAHKMDGVRNSREDGSDTFDELPDKV